MLFTDSRPFGVISEAIYFWDERQLQFPLSYNAVTIKSREKVCMSVRGCLFPSLRQQCVGQGWILVRKLSSCKASPPGQRGQPVFRAGKGMGAGYQRHDVRGRDVRNRGKTMENLVSSQNEFKLVPKHKGI